MDAWVVQWAAVWGIPAAALEQLTAYLTVSENDRVTAPETSEVGASQQIRLQSSKAGDRLWRNNTGAMYDRDGRLVRYGLANDSAKVSKSIKSSDLIGISPVIIQPYHVGQKLGVFKAVEVKRPGWKFSNTERETAQLRFLELVKSLGGQACFATTPQEAGYGS